MISTAETAALIVTYNRKSGLSIHYITHLFWLEAVISS